jgi:N-methylhydantoinase A
MVVRSYLCGVDVGGTFTDAVVIDAAGQVTLAKSPSTPDDFSRGFFAALEKAAASLGHSLEVLLERALLLSHGTTVATNAVVERRGAKVGLLTTAGHGDAILIMRAYGRAAGLSAAETLRFSATDKPQPLVPRSLIREIPERIDKRGEIVVALNEAAVVRAVNDLVAAGVEGIAVSLLWSFRNPVHEQRVRQLIEATAPDLFVTCSHELVPLLGEYERTVATVMNCYVGPLTTRYVERIASGAAHKGLAAPFLLMQCNGGLTPAAAATRAPLLLLQSGPCGGVVGAQALGHLLGHANIIATDMGGTTFDVGLVHAGSPLRTATTIVDQYEFYVPAIDVKSVGAGGGSIAWIDDSRGALCVGPMSAGAAPGPICYRRGGREPTVTDADVVLGYIDPNFFLGGNNALDRDAAHQAIAALGARLGLDVYQTAAGINRIADTHMADLIRRETIEKGLDPRDFALYSYGGAGPCHAGAYARELGVAQLVVPLTPTASVFSAFGVASSDIVHVHQRNQLMAAPFNAAALRATLDALEREARAELHAEGFSDAHNRFSFTADLRHRLQVHVVEVVLDVALSNDVLADTLVERFTARYEALYGAGTAYSDAGIELVTVRCTAAASARKPALQKHEEGPSTPAQAARAASRDVYWTEIGALHETEVYRADALLPGNVVHGPAIIEPTTTTIVVRPHQSARLDGYGNIFIDLNTRVSP